MKKRAMTRRRRMMRRRGSPATSRGARYLLPVASSHSSSPPLLLLPPPPPPPFFPWLVCLAHASSVILCLCTPGSLTTSSACLDAAANDVSSPLRRHLRAPTLLEEEEEEEVTMPQGAGGAAGSDAVSRVVTRMALQRLLELATGAIRNLLRGLGEATPARRVAPLGQFADVLLSSIDAIQQLASAEFLAAEFREFPAAEFRAAVEDLPEEGPERLARARNREHRVLEGQGPEAMSSLRGGPLLEPLPEPLLRGDPQVGAPPGLVAAAARPSRLTPGRMAFGGVEFLLLEQARTAAPPPARRRSSSSSSSPTEELGAEPPRWIIARSAAGGHDLSPPRREPRWTLARSRTPPRQAAQTSSPAQYEHRPGVPPPERRA